MRADTPLWGMPMTMESTPRSVLRSMSAFMPGMSVSQPSRPKRLAAANLLAQEGLEHLTPCQAVQDVQLAVRGVRELQMDIQSMRSMLARAWPHSS